jgi:hypothetical protein
MADSFKKHGAVFTVPLFHRRVTFLIGPEVSTHFYKARNSRALRRRPRATGAMQCMRSPRASALSGRRGAPRRAGVAKPSPAFSLLARRLAAPRRCGAPLGARRGSWLQRAPEPGPRVPFEALAAAVRAPCVPVVRAR